MQPFFCSSHTVSWVTSDGATTARTSTPHKFCLPYFYMSLSNMRHLATVSAGLVVVLPALIVVFNVAVSNHQADAAMTIALNSSGKWPDGHIPFRLDQTVTNFTRIQNVIVAMQQLEHFTGGCVRFRKHNGEKDFIIIQDESYTSNQTCFSYVGRTGMWQPVRFSTNCLNTTGDALHLLTRVVGLYPESNRPDRDQYISVQWNNILPEKILEYSIIPASIQTNVFSYFGYDFASITHYTQFQFSRNVSNSLPTWLLQRGVAHPGVEVNGTIGQRVGLSIGDVAAIRFLYNCNFSATPTPEVGCKGDTILSVGTFQRGIPAGWFFCKCNANNRTGDTYFFGERCQYSRCNPDCSKFPNTNCIVDESGLMAISTCQCNSGWQGQNCDQYYCPTPCLNGGVCVGPSTCKCPPEYPSGTCTAPYCYPECKNGGECVSSNQCRCPNGWTGPYCTEPVCLAPCFNQGVCVGPNICDCPEGYSGRRCQYSNITYGFPCTNDYDCQSGWGDPNSHCYLNTTCPGVYKTCICNYGFERLPSGGLCRYQRQIGDTCSVLYDVCQRNSECIEGICQCNPIKGWVMGPLMDCVKAHKSAYSCKNFDDCLYNKTCSDNGQCVCPTGMVPDEKFQSYTCRARKWGESCTVDDDCKFVGNGAGCRMTSNSDGSIASQACDCLYGIPYEILLDRYHSGKTCIPPFPQTLGDRCSGDFSLQRYGPCERGLVCELCPRTRDEFRCQRADNMMIAGATPQQDRYISLFTAFFIVILLLIS